MEQDNIIKNKARLITQDYNQEERIDFDKIIAPIATFEDIRLLLTFACFMDFKLF